jgi:hypothetical protein
MNSTWADNDHHRNTCSQRIEGMSKKQPINRLQVYLMHDIVYQK